MQTTNSQINSVFHSKVCQRVFDDSVGGDLEPLAAVLIGFRWANFFFYPENRYKHLRSCHFLTDYRWPRAEAILPFTAEFASG